MTTPTTADMKGKVRKPYATIKRREWEAMPAKTKKALGKMLECLAKAVKEGKI